MMRRWPHLLLLAALLLAFGLLLFSARQKSATVDEQTHWQRGSAYLQSGATQFLMGNPVVGHAFTSLMLLSEPELRQPLEHPAWAAGDWPVAGHLFLWVENEAPLRIVFLGRLVTIWLTIMLGALLFRWGRELSGAPVGLLAATLTLFDPNILAHGRLATNDLIVAFFMTVTLRYFWLYQRRPEFIYLLMTGIGLGVATAMKLNGAILVPILAVLSGVQMVRERRWRPLPGLLLLGLVSWLTIYALFGFELRPLPGGAFWDDLFWQLDYLGGEQGVYLAGEVSAGGWWYYFPVALLLKTPLVTLGLLLLAVFVPLWSARRPGRLTTLWLPCLIYFAFTQVNALNIGYRYLLPILPWLMLFIAARLWPIVAERAAWRRALAGVVVLLPLLALWLWPHYLPFFNSLVGGPDGGWRYLSDSNVDWGQDLPGLRVWQVENKVELWLSYFGTAAPSAYGLEFTALPTWPPTPEQLPPDRQPFVPANPAPGFYAISVTHLHGAVLGDDSALYAYFRDREPIARVGGSIFIYEVIPRGGRLDLALGGVIPAELPAALISPDGNNNRQLRWFDPSQALLLPAGGQAIFDATPPAALIGLAQFESQAGLTLSSGLLVETDTAATFEDQLAFLSYREVTDEVGRPYLATIWEVVASSGRPLKLFLHEVDAAGSILWQWDGLGVEAHSWQAGDRFVQLIPAPPQAAESSSGLLGVYDAETLVRLHLVDRPGDDYIEIDPYP